MPFVPGTVTSDYALIENHNDFTGLKELSFPRDAMRLCWLSLAEKQVWYASRDPQEMITLSLDPQFKRFWQRFYSRPLKLKRALYKLKFW